MTLRVAGANLPLGGGGSFRHLPYGLTRAASRNHGPNGDLATLYLHPWELDPEQPRLEGISFCTIEETLTRRGLLGSAAAEGGLS